MTARAHRIGRQEWRVRASSLGEAFAWRTALRTHLEDGILPVLDQAFEQAQAAWSDTDSVLQISRLHLRVRARDIEQLLHALPEAVRRGLAHALEQSGKAQAPGLPRQVGVHREGRHEFDADALQHYLMTGNLHWAVAGEGPALALARLKQAATELSSRPILLRAAMAHPMALLRLMPLLERPQRLRACAVAGGAGRAPALCSALHWLLEAGDLPEAPHVQLTALLLYLSLELDVRAVPIELGAGVRTAAERLESLQRSRAVPPEVVMALAQAPYPGTSAVESPPGVSSQTQALETDRTARASVQAADARHAAEGRAASAPNADPELEASPESRAPRSARSLIAARSDDARGACSVTEPSAEVPSVLATAAPNAGLILLHPYLPRLFGTLGWSSPRGDAVRAAFLPSAAALLHWLATGSDELHEFELPAVKLLLGQHPDTPVAVSAGLLDARAREEGEALLRAAIEHWAVLRNTGIDGLRVSFLRRRGWLRPADPGYRIQIESASYDLLVGQLPWGISIIKLPWARYPIHVEWPLP